MPDFNAPAKLYRLEMTAVQKGRPLPLSPRLVHEGTIAECVAMVLAERDRNRRTYSVTVGLDAGFEKSALYYDDIEAIAQRSDFPAPPK